MTKVLVLGKIQPEGIALLKRSGIDRVEEHPDHPPGLAALVRDADAIIVRMTRIGADVVAAAPHLRLVARHGVGYEAVDVAALTARGIPLALVGDVNSGAVAEHTIAMMLALAKRLIVYDRAVRNGGFAIRDTYSLVELDGRTLLMIGFGRIGRAVARRALAFGMRVVAYDPFVPAELADTMGVPLAVDLAAALPEADFVSVHAPKPADRPCLLGPGEIARMKPGAFVLNVARGGMVDEAALARALADGRLGGAALDVFDPEPPPPGHPLFGRDDVVLSPHCAAFTDECGRRMAVACARNVLDAFAGRLDPALVVNAEVLAGGSG